MVTGLKDEEIRREIFEAMQEDKPPYASYIKTITGGVVVRFLDPIRMIPAERILKGILGEAPEEDVVIKVWSQAEDIYLKRNNRPHFESGRLIPYTEEQKEINTINQISDADIELILQKPFFTLKNKLDEFTSPVPVRRFLIAAERMNRPIGTITYIQERLSEMEMEPQPLESRVDIDM